ncbi:hypothetical protein GDO81_013641 [Engystomops pustulosus]|uniref:Uncharacterized protein n=1 Tax=Engystomops pustulosus TaxID=76066 RepID=A0AAV7B3G6_ENGPU|nr:hypothetical protein GDO81_013641 [Engystomops pustulosus]
MCTKGGGGDCTPKRQCEVTRRTKERLSITSSNKCSYKRLVLGGSKRRAAHPRTQRKEQQATEVKIQTYKRYDVNNLEHNAWHWYVIHNKYITKYASQVSIRIINL